MGKAVDYAAQEQEQFQTVTGDGIHSDPSVPPRYKDAQQHKHDVEKDTEHIAKGATVDVASERSLTFGTMIKGDVASRMTVFERKAALINAYVPPPIDR